jgi:hypothetical protein
MLRKFMFVLGVAGILLQTGCSTCNSCGHPLFAKHRRCDPCENGGAIPPTNVPVVPPPPGAAVAPPPPLSSGYGPTPDVVVTGQRPVYVNSYSGRCGCN